MVNGQYSCKVARLDSQVHTQIPPSGPHPLYRTDVRSTPAPASTGQSSSSRWPRTAQACGASALTPPSPRSLTSPTSPARAWRTQGTRMTSSAWSSATTSRSSSYSAAWAGRWTVTYPSSWFIPDQVLHRDYEDFYHTVFQYRVGFEFKAGV